MKERDIWIILAIIALLFTSCGAKEKVVQKEVRTQKNDIVVVKTEEIKTDTDFSKIIEQINFEPVDPTQENHVTITDGVDSISIIGKNTRVFQKTETIDSAVTKVEVRDSSVVDKSEINSREVKKEIDSEGWNWRGLNWFLVLLIASIVVWIFFRKKTYS